MAVGVEVCPACRRPRSEDEVDAARAARGEHAASLRARRARLAVLGALAALSAGAYSQRQALRAAAGRAVAGLRAEFERVSNPSGAKPASASAAVAAAQAARAESAVNAPAPPAAEGSAPASAAAPPAPSEAAPDPGPVRPYEEPGSPFPEQARVYGVVYDMVTLRPVHPARLLFRLPNNGVSEAATDAQGRYRIDLFISHLDEGVSVSVTAAGYREGQLEDGGQPYRMRTLKSRQGTIEETAPSDLEPLRVGRPDSRGLVPLDLVLLPN